MSAHGSLALVLALTLVGESSVSAQDSLRAVQLLSSDCGGEWSEERFLDALKVELLPFAELAEPAGVLVRLSGGCQQSVLLTISGSTPTERLVHLEDIPAGARERAVAMAMARLVESVVDPPEPAGASSEGLRNGGVADAGASSAQAGADALPAPPRGATTDGGGRLPRQPMALGLQRERDETSDTLANETASAEPAVDERGYTRRYVEASAALGWLRVGGAGYGANLAIGLPVTGPLFFVGGATFLRAHVSRPVGSVSLSRLEAHVGLGLARYFGVLGIEARVLARAGWAIMSAGSSSSPIVRSGSALSLAFQLDAGFALRLRRAEVVLRVGPLFVAKGLAAEHPLYSFIHFRGIALAVAGGLRIPF